MGELGVSAVPTIIEAAESLFANHSVNEISHAFARNLDVTCGELIRAIEQAQSQGKRIICFVTGIPGPVRPWPA